MKALFAASLLLVLGIGQANANYFDQDELQRNQICRPEFCQTPDDGLTFRETCRLHDRPMPGLVWVVLRNDGSCYCPCRSDYLYFGRRD